MREYVIVSIKHSNFPFEGCLVYWGHLTLDAEERCFSGYTFDLNKCERYDLNEIMRKDLHLYNGGGLAELEENEDVIIKVSDLVLIDQLEPASIVYRV